MTADPSTPEHGVRDGRASLGDVPAGVDALRSALSSLVRHLVEETSTPFTLPPNDPTQDDRLTELVSAIGLSRTEHALLVLAAAPNIDPQFNRLLGSDPDRPATVAELLDVLGLSLLDPVHRSLFHRDSRLRRFGLIHIDENGHSLSSWRPDVPDRLIGHLLGDDRLDPVLSAALTPVVAVATADADVIGEAVESEIPLIWLLERTPSSARMCAAAAAEQMDRPILFVAAPTSSTAAAEPVIRAGVLEAVLRGAILCIGPLERDHALSSEMIRLLSDAPCPAVLFTGSAGQDGPVHAPELWHELQPMSHRDREAMWKAVLNRLQVADPVDCDVLAAQNTTVDRAFAAVLRAIATARVATRDIATSDILTHLRTLAVVDADVAARTISPKIRLEDLVLSPDSRVELERITSRIHSAEQVLDEWGVAALAGVPRGLRVLFVGPPGTGKTLTAEALAGELGVNLLAVDLADTVDKYIGETEKKLEQTFRIAETESCVLFFDEADSLFGKRTAVKDSHDRYANASVSYLLQRIEKFSGITVLASNLRGNLDEAFVRRFEFVIPFDEPDFDVRRRLWNRHIPESLPTDGDIDFDALAGFDSVTHAMIRNATVDAAHLAAAEGVALRHTHLIEGLRHAHRVAGRLFEIPT